MKTKTIQDERTKGEKALRTVNLKTTQTVTEILVSKVVHVRGKASKKFDFQSKCESKIWAFPHDFETARKKVKNTLQMMGYTSQGTQR